MHRSTGYLAPALARRELANAAITAGPNAFLTARNDNLITYQG
jgi:hypothetical protein